MSKSGEVGRPREYSDEEIEQIIEIFNAYIDETDIPIVAEFAYTNDITRQTLYDYQEFATVLKKCIDKKEAALEREGLKNRVNVGMAIMSLKQLGWSDKLESLNRNKNENTDIKIDLSNMTEDEKRNLLKERLNAIKSKQ